MLNAGKSVADEEQHLHVNEATFHRWRNQYDGMKLKEARRLKELELQSARLKRLLTEAELDKTMLMKLASGNPRGRWAAAARS